MFVGTYGLRNLNRKINCVKAAFWLSDYGNFGILEYPIKNYYSVL
jgi:hypothetical protein